MPALDSSTKFLLELAPGLITYLVFRAITRPYSKYEPVPTVAWSFALTLWNHATWEVLLLIPWKIVAIPDLVGLSLCAVFWGMLGGAIYVNDWFFRFLRWIGISRESTYETVWTGAFHRYFQRYIVVVLDDGRRVYGWPTGFPARQKEGHLLLTKAQWLDSDNETTPLQTLLINADDVRFIQFLD